MKNWKDKVLIVFASIGFMTLLMGNYSQKPDYNIGNPESHVWEIYGAEGNYAFALNKVTGEIRGISASRNYYDTYISEDEKKVKR